MMIRNVVEVVLGCSNTVDNLRFKNVSMKMKKGRKGKKVFTIGMTFKGKSLTQAVIDAGKQ